MYKKYVPAVAGILSILCLTACDSGVQIDWGPSSEETVTEISVETGTDLPEEMAETTLTQSDTESAFEVSGEATEGSLEATTTVGEETTINEETIIPETTTVTEEETTTEATEVGGFGFTNDEPEETVP